VLLRLPEMLGFDQPAGNHRFDAFPKIRFWPGWTTVLLPPTLEPLSQTGTLASQRALEISGRASGREFPDSLLEGQGGYPVLKTVTL